MTRNSYRSGQLAAAIATIVAGGTFAGAGAALAQDQQAIEEVTVTGSRIGRSGMATPVPVTTLDSAEMSTLGPGLLMNAVNQLPQFSNNIMPDPQSTGRYAAGADGQSFVNMRGMGANRTLVLLDGRRVVPTSNAGSNDINLFPEALIQRMEVVTGGASAAYGSDAVTGVTNFILDTRFTGVSALAQGGVSRHGDGENQKLSFTYGTEVGSRGHFVGSVEYFSSDSLVGWDKRSWFNDWALIQNPDPNGPTLITVPNVSTTQYTYGGLILTGPMAGHQFLADGSVVPFRRGEIVGTNSQSGGDGVNIRRHMEIMPEIERRNAFAHASFDVTDATTLFVQGIIADSRGDYQTSQTALHAPFGDATIFRDNAFLPDVVRIAMEEAGVESFRMGRRSTLNELRQERGSKNDVYSITIGADHEFDNGWQLTSYYQYGKNERQNTSYTTRQDRVYRAIDAVLDGSGNIVCRSTLTFPDDGCVPANFFGEGNVSAAAEDYIMDWRVGTIEVAQHFAEVAAFGDIHDGWGAGPISAAFGASYREDTLDAYVDEPPGLPSAISPDFEQGYRGLPPNLVGDSELYLANEMLTANGGYSVNELFSEVNLPLLSDRPAVSHLELNVAARYADYSGSGGVLAWKGGLDWRLNDQVRLRATRSRDTRAANLGERFIWLRSSGGVDNPWTGETGVPPRDGTIAGGNPQVEPELSDTLTFGIVYQPARINDFSVSLDYYTVDIRDAIAQVGLNNIINQCFTEGSFCNLIQQDPTTLEILRVDDVYINLDEATASGWDIEARYGFQLGSTHSFTFRVLGSYLDENSISTPLGTKVERAGFGTYPKLTATAMLSYHNGGAFDATLSSRYIGDATISNVRVEGIDVDHNRVASANYLNLRLGYDFSPRVGDFSLFANIENLLDKDPPMAVNTLSGWTGSPHTNSNFDQIGRRYTIGFRYAL